MSVQTLPRQKQRHRNGQARQAMREAAAWLTFGDSSDSAGAEVALFTALHLLRRVEIDILQNGSIEGPG